MTYHELVTVTDGDVHLRNWQIGAVEATRRNGVRFRPVADCPPRFRVAGNAIFVSRRELVDALTRIETDYVEQYKHETPPQRRDRLFRERDDVRAARDRSAPVAADVAMEAMDRLARIAELVRDAKEDLPWRADWLDEIERLAEGEEEDE